MSTTQLGQRMGLSRQGIADLEQREMRGAVTLGTLQKAADALEADLIYVIIPRRSLDATLQAQARTVAEAELQRVAHTMHLEAQDVSADEYARQLADRAEALLRDEPRRVWDVEEPSASE
jgi:predicted DNA-binding mobile mystery protein A